MFVILGKSLVHVLQAVASPSAMHLQASGRTKLNQRLRIAGLNNTWAPLRLISLWMEKSVSEHTAIKRRWRRKLRKVLPG